MLDPVLYDRLDALLADDDARRARLYPGVLPRRQPVHTVYVPADRYAEHTVTEWRSGALAALDEHGPLPGVDAALDSFLAAGAGVLVLAAASGSDGYDSRPELEEADWTRLLGNLDRLAAHAAGRGVRACLHPHVGTMVETADDVTLSERGTTSLPERPHPSQPTHVAACDL